MLAAVFGGGLKAFGVEVPALQSIRRQLILALIGVALLAVLAFAHWPPRSEAGPDIVRGSPSATPTSAGEPALEADPVPVVRSDERMLEVQKLLVELGKDPGQVDGVGGLRTELAIRSFQQEHGMQPDGLPGPRTIALMRQEAAAK